MDYSYVQDFKKLGYGLFIHFGLYSAYEAGEWYWSAHKQDGEGHPWDPITFDQYLEGAKKDFAPKKNWARDICRMAKKAGMRYACLTSRHHEGFSLYDTKGLNEYDAPHYLGRDLVKEFIDACHEFGLVPFLYHTVIDWWNPDFLKGDFPAYFDYLEKSIRLLCTNYGPIGGFWFDGTWGLPKGVNFPSRIYEMIRSLQPTAIITNNTGLSALGQQGSDLLDCVTFERGKPFPVNNPDRPLAGEVCDSLTDHWGYAKDDIHFKSVPYVLEELIDARAAGCNLLLNVGPKPDGSISTMEKETLYAVGRWLKKNKSVILNAEPSSWKAENAMVLENEKRRYFILKDVPMASDANVARIQETGVVRLGEGEKFHSPRYVDNGEKVALKDRTSFMAKPFYYGSSWIARVVEDRK